MSGALTRRLLAVLRPAQVVEFQGIESGEGIRYRYDPVCGELRCRELADEDDSYDLSYFTDRFHQWVLAGAPLEALGYRNLPWWLKQQYLAALGGLP